MERPANAAVLAGEMGTWKKNGCQPGVAARWPGDASGFQGSRVQLATEFVGPVRYAHGCMRWLSGPLGIRCGFPGAGRGASSSGIFAECASIAGLSV